MSQFAVVSVRSVFQRICLLLVTVLALSLPTQGTQAEDFNQPLSWDQKVISFELNRFNSRLEVYEYSKSLLNQVEDDDRLKFAEKKQLRSAIGLLEAKIASRLPELKLVGFKKSWIEEGNPQAGYVLEPEYQ